MYSRLTKAVGSSSSSINTVGCIGWHLHDGAVFLVKGGGAGVRDNRRDRQLLAPLLAWNPRTSGTKTMHSSVWACRGGLNSCRSLRYHTIGHHLLLRRHDDLIIVTVVPADDPPNKAAYVPHEPNCLGLEYTLINKEFFKVGSI